MLDYLSPAPRPVVDGLEEYETTYARNQPPYNPLRVLRSNGQKCAALSRWTFTPEQRRAIADGADLFLEVLTFGNRLQPVRIAISSGPGAAYIHEIYDLRAEKTDHFSANRILDTEGPLTPFGAAQPFGDAQSAVHLNKV